MTAEPGEDHAGPPPAALALRRIVRRMGRRAVIRGATATFRLGELTLIRGQRGAGKSVLARLIAGQILPESGRIERLGPAAPLVGASWGFIAEAPVTQGLDLRAASYGLALRPYAAAVLSMLDDREAARRHFNRLSGRDRQALLYASAYLIPSTVYVADGALLPSDRELRGRLEPLLAAARRQAAVIWIADVKASERGFRPDQLLRLENGALAAEGEAAEGTGEVAAEPEDGPAEPEEDDAPTSGGL